MLEKLVLQALASYGEREIDGPKRSSFIGRLIDRWFRKNADDSTTAWCAIWLSDVVTECGLTPPPLSLRAKSWASWGTEVLTAKCGSVVVLKRGKNLFHVTIAIRYTDDGRIWCLGGNQSNSVSIAAYSTADIVTIREPG